MRLRWPGDREPSRIPADPRGGHGSSARAPGARLRWELDGARPGRGAATWCPRVGPTWSSIWVPAPSPTCSHPRSGPGRRGGHHAPPPRPLDRPATPWSPMPGSPCTGSRSRSTHRPDWLIGPAWPAHPSLDWHRVADGDSARHRGPQPVASTGRTTVSRPWPCVSTAPAEPSATLPTPGPTGRWPSSAPASTSCCARPRTPSITKGPPAT